MFLRSVYFIKINRLQRKTECDKTELFLEGQWCLQRVWTPPYFSLVCPNPVGSLKHSFGHAVFVSAEKIPHLYATSLRTRHLLGCWPPQGHRPCVSQRWAWTHWEAVQIINLPWTTWYRPRCCSPAKKMYPRRHSTGNITEIGAQEFYTIWLQSAKYKSSD